MDIINILISTNATIILALGIITFLRNKKDEATRAFFAMVIFIVLWSVGMIMYRATNSASGVIMWGKATYIFAAFIPLLYLNFTLKFTGLYKIKQIYLYLSFLPFFTVFMWPNALVKGGELLMPTTNNVLHFGWASWIYIAYFSTYFLGGMLILYKHYTQASGVNKNQTLFVLVGSSVPILVGSFANLYLPHFGIFTISWLGNIAIIFLVGCIAYAIMKHNLFNIRVIATEFFAGLIVLVFLIEVFRSDTTQDIIFNSVLFVILCIFAFMMVRGTIREINTLEELSETKSEFLSIASHQLRTPISVLKGYLSMLREGSYGKLSSKQLDVINKAYRANEGMLMLVNDFLNLSRAEKGTLKYNFEKIDLRDMIDAIVDEFQITAKDKGLDLNWNKPKDPILVDVDRDKFRQVVANIIDNAIKYTREGGVSVRLTTDVMFGNVAKIFISDTGMGIEPGEEGKIFKSFERGNRGEKENVTGAGLGLYVVKMITEGHGGTIKAESKGLNKGTTFIIELPLATNNSKKHETEQSLHKKHN
ncbi:MAG: ATP-binding protein [Candidatus Spechtbacterales bacterium]|nr:ATP-binding protein [Candidatus Spechtbacterales bacterium]